MIPVLKPNLPRINHRHPLARGLRAAYPFFEGKGDSRLFDIARGNHGTFVSSPTWGVSKPWGRRLSFNGSSDYITLPAILSSSGTENTFAMLVKADTTTTQYFAFVYNNEGQNLSILLNNSTNEVRAFVVDEDTTNAVTTTSFTTTNWLWVVGTSKENDVVEMFVNGASQGTAAQGDFVTATTTNRVVGVHRNESQNFLAGQVADLRIWDRALSASEVYDMYINPWALYSPRRIDIATENVTEPLGEVSVVGDIGILADISSVSTKELNRVGSFGVNVELSGSITKDFRNVQTFRGAMGIVADLDGVVSAQFTRERNGQIDIVAEFDSPVTFEKMKSGQIDAIVDLVASTTEGDTPVTDQDIGEAIVFRAPKIDYVFRARKHPTGRRL